MPADGTVRADPSGPVEPLGAPRTARARARMELTREIVDTARAHVAEHGAAELSLRAVARDLGMVSSAVYRYFPSRDELLTALIIETYDTIGELAEHAHSRSIEAGDDHGLRWLAVCRSVRSWAIDHPREWALVYGSPIVGYAAPQDTIEPAGRIGRVLAAVARDARDAGVLTPPVLPGAVPRLATDGVLEVIGGRPPAPFADLGERMLGMWVMLVGAINFELFGHLNNVVTDHAGYFDTAMAQAAGMIGLDVAAPRPGQRPARSRVSRRG